MALELQFQLFPKWVGTRYSGLYLNRQLGTRELWAVETCKWAIADLNLGSC